MRLGLVGAVIGAVIGSAACTGLDGLTGGDDPSNPRPDGGDGGPSACSPDLQRDHDNCGACGTVCGEIEHCLAGKCAPGCPDHIVYVSADGNDNASGCTTATPKRTVGAAIAFLETLGAQQHEVHVCRGVYDESVVLDYPASLMGGYECATWKRSDKYGSPSFDGVNETVIAGGAAAGPSLTVTKVAGVTIDGLTIRAKDGSGTDQSVGVLVTENAQPTFSNTKIAGGGGQIAASPASIGLLVDTLSTVEVKSCLVEGGGATNTTTGGYGSAGVYLTKNAGNAHILESRLDGGSGKVSGGTGSVGFHALGGSLAGGGIERSIVNGGKGRTNTIGSASIGVSFFNLQVADVDILGSTIEGGSGTCGGDCGVTGVSVSTEGRVRIQGNRVSGGEIDPDTVQDLRFTGMRVASLSSGDVQNNFVFSGNTTDAFAASATAFEITGADAVLVANNTFALGPSRSTTGSVVTAAAKSATFANNLLLFARSLPIAAAVDLDGCAARTYKLQANTWVGFPDGAPLLTVDRDGGPGPGGCVQAAISAATADALESGAAGAFGAGNVAGNRRVATTCGADAKCTAVAACGTASGCLDTILAAGWDAATAGGLVANGWKLKDGVGCSIAKGAVAVPGLLATDAYGAMRTDPRSIGAHEHDGACQ